MERLMKTKTLRFISFFYFLLILFNQDIIAQKTFGAGKTRADSVVKINLTDSENDSLEFLKHRREFAYMNYLDSLLRKKSDLKSDTARINPKTGKIISEKKSSEDHSAFNKILNSYPLQLFFWALAIIFICFILYKIIYKNGLFDKPATSSYEKEDEASISGLDHLSKYDALINDAEAKNDFTLATRYLFLQMLAVMADKEIITFSPEKTNHDYLKEVPADDQNAFSFLSLRYEYIWYGKFVISKKRYLDLKNDFSIFITKLKTA